MVKTSNEERRKAKQELILDSARIVFCQKGFLDVTMKDIIDECGISRGGIYLYFSSVEEIFRTVVIRRNKSKFKTLRQSIHENIDYYRLMDWYLAAQKERLLNMENSLLRAMYEYLFTHTGEAAAEIRNAQVENIRKTISAILHLGVSQNAINEEDIPVLSDNLMFVIEGLSVYALLGGLSEEHIDNQFSHIKTILQRERG